MAMNSDCCGFIDLLLDARLLPYAAYFEPVSSLFAANEELSGFAALLQCDQAGRLTIDDKNADVFT